MRLYIDLTEILKLDNVTDPAVSVTQEQWREIRETYPTSCYGDERLLNAPMVFSIADAPNPYRIDLSAILDLVAPNDLVAVSKDQWEAIDANPEWEEHCFGGKSKSVEERERRTTKRSERKKSPKMAAEKIEEPAAAEEYEYPADPECTMSARRNSTNAVLLAAAKAAGMTTGHLYSAFTRLALPHEKLLGYVHKVKPPFKYADAGVGEGKPPPLVTDDPIEVAKWVHKTSVSRFYTGNNPVWIYDASEDIFMRIIEKFDVDKEGNLK